MWPASQTAASLWQDAEKARQRRSHFVQILNVLQRVRIRSSLAAALPAERRVLARRGWAGEIVGRLSILPMRSLQRSFNFN
jgi:hypothetical protein